MGLIFNSASFYAIGNRHAEIKHPVQLYAAYEPLQIAAIKNLIATHFGQDLEFILIFEKNV